MPIDDARAATEAIQLMTKLMVSLLESYTNKKGLEAKDKEIAELKKSIPEEAAKKIKLWKNDIDEFLERNFEGEWKENPETGEKHYNVKCDVKTGVPVFHFNAPDVQMFVDFTNKVNPELSGIANEKDRARIIAPHADKFMETMSDKLKNRALYAGKSEQEASIFAKAGINALKKQVMDKLQEQGQKGDMQIQKSKDPHDHDKVK